MVAQIVCVVCSLSLEPSNTELTFHRFPTESTALIIKWQNALGSVLSRVPVDAIKDSVICSRHFTSEDFSFVDGKLILKSDAVPSVFPETKADSDHPPIHGSNFASTSTVNNMTVSRHYPRTTSTCTETTKIVTPSSIESLVLPMIDIDGELAKTSATVKMLVRQNKLLRLRVRRLKTVLKRMQKDDVLTDDYLDSLEVKVRAIFLLSPFR